MVATLFLVGAGLGFWIVRKFILMPDGTPDPQTALFIKWALRALGVVFCFLVPPRLPPFTPTLPCPVPACLSQTMDGHRVHLLDAVRVSLLIF